MTSTSIATEPAPKMKGTTGEMGRSVEEVKPEYINTVCILKAHVYFYHLLVKMNSIILLRNYFAKTFYNFNMLI